MPDLFGLDGVKVKSEAERREDFEPLAGRPQA